MLDIGFFCLILVLVNLGVSYYGLKDFQFFEKYQFNIDAILIRKEYFRLLTSGFLHVSWSHLLFNMLSLYFFGPTIENGLGGGILLLIYFLSLISGNLLSIFVHRNHSDYASVGASGAVSGIVFAVIALEPGMELGLLFLPFSFPAWLYGLGFVAVSIYGIKSGKSTVGHDAHLGGAIVGLLTAVVLVPDVLKTNLFVILIIVIPTLVFLIVIISKPHVLLFEGMSFRPKAPKLTIDQKYNAERTATQEQVDKILEKISEKGIGSLSAKEKQILDEYSKK